MKNKKSLNLGSTTLSSAWLFSISKASYNLLNKAKDLPVISNLVLFFDNFSYKRENDFYVSTPLSGEYNFKTQNIFKVCSALIMQPKK